MALLAGGFLVGVVIGAVEILAADGLRASIIDVLQPMLAGEAVSAARRFAIVLNKRLTQPASQAVAG